MDLRMINDFMMQFLWMDFELVRINPQTVELHGFIDEAYEDKIIITFSSVHMADYEGNGNFISIANDHQSRSINYAYDVTVGNTVFVLSNTNIQGDMFIVAKKVEMEVLP